MSKIPCEYSGGEYACGCLYIAANTDPSVVANRQAAMSSLISAIEAKNATCGIGSIRYAGGYFHTYIVCNPTSTLWFVMEYTQGLSEAIILWQRTNPTTWGRIFSVNKTT